MIAKGNFHSHGVRLAAYLVKAELGERGELIDMRGFGPVSDLRDGFRVEQIRAQDGTKAEKPFFHVHLRGAHGEGAKLSRENWKEIADRCDKALGPAMADQPRAASLHIDRRTGDMHLHLGYSLVAENAEGKLHVLKLGLYKNKLKHLARELEKDYGLKIVGNERQAGDQARAPDRNEFEESRRLGTDLKAIRTGILDGFEKSDNGRALKAALDDRGLQLANGDRRDCFVVIDAGGGQHALNKKLTGKTLEEIRTRLADLDRSTLPSVEQAKEMEAGREAARAAQERGKHGRGADGHGPGQATTHATEPQRAPQPEIKPLGKTAGEIRLAWTLTATAGQFAQAIEHRGLILVHVSREEAEASHRVHAFAGNQSRELREGFGVVDQRGNVTRIDQRTTGDQWEEIQKRLGGVDTRELISVAEAREIMREVNRAAWAEQQQAKRDAARPATGIEAKILDAEKTAQGDRAKFAAELERAGVGLARVTAADVKALDALRQDEQFAAAADPAHPVRYFPQLEPGELAAVDRYGGVHRLNPHHLEDIEKRLPETQASVVEVRAAFEIDRSAAAGFQQQMIDIQLQRQADSTAARVLGSEARDADREIRSAAQTVDGETRDIIGAAEQAVDKGTRVFGGMLRDIAKLGEKFIDFLGDIFAPTAPPTRQEAEGMRRAAKERQQEAADLAAAAESKARLDDLLRQIARDDAERGRQQRERGDHDQVDRGRERER